MSDEKHTAWDDAHSLGIALRLAHAQNRELRKQLADSTSEVSRKFQDGICSDCESPDLCIQDNGCHNTGKVFSRIDHPSQQWQPIDTAPKDGQEVIAFHPDFDTQYFVRWVQPEGQAGCWYEDFAMKSMSGFTHWSPLPEPPMSDK